MAKKFQQETNSQEQQELDPTVLKGTPWFYGSGSKDFLLWVKINDQTELKFNWDLIPISWDFLCFPPRLKSLINPMGVELPQEKGGNAPHSSPSIKIINLFPRNEFIPVQLTLVNSGGFCQRGIPYLRGKDPAAPLGSTFALGFMATGSWDWNFPVGPAGLELGKRSGKSSPNSRGRNLPPHPPVGSHSLLHQGLVGERV